MSFLKKVKEIIIHPVKFFSKIRNEPIKQSLLYFLKWLLIIISLFAVFLYFSLELKYEWIFSLELKYEWILRMIVAIPLSFLGVIAYGSIIHFLAEKLGGEGYLFDGWKIYIYSYTPLFFLATIATISLLIFLGVIKMYGSVEVLVVDLFKASGLLLLSIGVVWSLFLLPIGIKTIYKIPTIKAILAIAIFLIISYFISKLGLEALLGIWFISFMVI